MRKVKLPLLFLLLICLFGFSPNEDQYEPIFMFRADMESAVKLEGARILENPGKIYIKDNYLFIVEKYMGVHIIDNVNPKEPDKLGFIHIDGCVDIAVKGNILYADNAVDLLAIKFSDSFTTIEVTSRNRNVFPEFLSPDGSGLSWRQEQARPNNAVLVRWKENW